MVDYFIINLGKDRMKGCNWEIVLQYVCFPALFLVRDDSFLQNVPARHKSAFIDENPIAPSKLEMLKKEIKERFPVSISNSTLITVQATWLLSI